MTNKQAQSRLKKVGFTMEGDFGYKKAEPFEFGKNHILSIPRRNVFIAQMYANDPEKTFWYITSNITFTARKYRCRQTYHDSILNIFGAGKTLELALNKFVSDFLAGRYNRA